MRSVSSLRHAAVAGTDASADKKLLDFFFVFYLFPTFLDTLSAVINMLSAFYASPLPRNVPRQTQNNAAF